MSERVSFAPLVMRFKRAVRDVRESLVVQCNGESRQIEVPCSAGGIPPPRLRAKEPSWSIDSINLDEKGAQVEVSGSSDSISPRNLMAK